MKNQVRLLTYEDCLANENTIVRLMQSIDPEYGLEYCREKTKEILSFLTDGSAIIAAAFQENEVIGYAWGYLRENRGISRIHITQLVVDEKHRGKGIGKELLEFMQNQCVKNMCAGLELNVSAKNSDAQRFYQKNDFVCETLFLSKDIQI